MTLNGPFIAVRGPSSTWRIMVFCASVICAHVSGAKAVADELGIRGSAWRGRRGGRALRGQIRRRVAREPKEQSHVTTSRLRMG